MTAANHVVRAIRQAVPTLVKNAEQVSGVKTAGCPLPCAHPPFLLISLTGSWGCGLLQCSAFKGCHGK